MNRPYKIVSGISYPNLYVDDDEQPRRASKMSDPESQDHYYDTAIRLSKHDVNGFVGKPLCLEHDESVVIGKITASWVDRDNHMRLSGRIYIDTPEGRETYDRINHGDLSGLSVGYSVIWDRDDPSLVVGKRFDEVSVCKQPFFKGAELRVAASEKVLYKNSQRKLTFKIMASEGKNLPETPEAAVTLESKNKDSSEMARVHDDLLKINEERAARLAELEEKNRMWEELEEKRRIQYAEENKPMLADVLKVQEEQFREEHGEEAQLPAEFVNATTVAFTDPAAKSAMSAIVASVKSYKRAQEQRNAQEEKIKAHQKEMSEMKEKLQKLSDDQSLAMTHVSASQRRLRMTMDKGKEEEREDQPEKSTPIQASTKLDVSQLFVPQPSEEERRLYHTNYGRAIDTKITASATPKTLPPIPDYRTEKIKAHTQRSMRNDKYGQYNFQHLVANSQEFLKFGSPVQRDVEYLDH